MSSPQMANYLALDRPRSDAAQPLPLGHMPDTVPALHSLPSHGPLHMKTNTALFLKVLQSTAPYPHPAVPVCHADALATRTQSTLAQEQETAMLSSPLLCWLFIIPSFLVQHPFWTKVLHATGPSPHRTLHTLCPSTHTAFIHVSPVTKGPVQVLVARHHSGA